jgi:intracellular septation protein
VNFLLDFAPGLLFLAAYFIGGIYVATAVLIASLFAVVAYYWFAHGRLHKLHMGTAIVAAVFGGLTLYIHDPVFIQLKPSVLYAISSGVLLGSHFIGDKVLLQRIPQHALSLPDPVWRKVNLAWGLYFAWCAVLNLYVASHFELGTWVKFKAFGFTAMMLLFVLAHVPFLIRYLPQQQE